MIGLAISSRSFGTPVTTLEELREVVARHACIVAERLRKQGSVAAAVHAFILTNRFREDQPQFNGARTVPLPKETDDMRALALAALQGLEEIFRPGYSYKKAGVMLALLSDKKMLQGDLFIVIPSIKRTLETTPPLTGHPSIEGNYLGASRGKGKNRRPGFIPLYGGVARSAGVVRAACHAGAVSAFNCVNYYNELPVRNERSKKLMAAIDAVNGKYGRGVLSLAAVGTGKSGAMRADRLSQRYTTRWDELPIVE